MALMSRMRYKRLSDELITVKEKLEDAMVEQADAREKGDLRENAEYESARQEVENYARRKAEIETELAEAEIVESDNSPTISIDSVVDVCRVDAAGNPIESARRFRVDAKGDTIIQGILGVRSSLGKAILNGTDGIYRVVDNGGVSYLVKKVHE